VKRGASQRNARHKKKQNLESSSHLTQTIGEDSGIADSSTCNEEEAETGMLLLVTN